MCANGICTDVHHIQISCNDSIGIEPEALLIWGLCSFIDSLESALPALSTIAAQSLITTENNKMVHQITLEDGSQVFITHELDNGQLVEVRTTPSLGLQPSA